MLKLCIYAVFFSESCQTNPCKNKHLYCLWYVKNVMVDKNIMRQMEYTSFLQFLKIRNDLESYGIYEEKFLWEM